MELYGVDTSLLNAEQIISCFVIPKNANPLVVFKRARRRQRAWAYNPSSVQYWTLINEAKGLLDKAAKQRTINRLRALIERVKLEKDDQQK